MADRSVVVRLKAEIAGFKAAMADAARAAKQVGEGAKTAATQAKTNFGQLTTSVRAQRQEWDDLSSKMLIGGTVIAGGLGLATKAAIDWETAWAGVTKTTDGTPAQMAELEAGLRGLTKVLPATHEEIAGVAEAAGQLGIAREDIVSFTETAIALGESTNLSAEEAAEGLAKISNVMGTSAREGVAGYEKLGTTLVALGNAGASTERDILAMTQRLTGAGKLVGATEADLLALANAASSVGIESELGGSALQRAMLEMNTAVKSGGKELETFARTAGLSASEFAEKWNSDPVEALRLFTVGLGEVSASGGDASSVLSEVGLSGTQNAQVLLRLAGASDILTASLAMGAEEWANGTALQDEAAKRYKTTASRMQIAQNSMRDAAIDLGSVAGPALASVAEKAAGLANAFVQLPGPVKNAVTGIAGLASAALLLGGGTIKAIGFTQDLGDALDKIGAKGPKTEKALRGTEKAVKGLGAALATVAVIGAAGHAAGLGEDFLGKISNPDLMRGMLKNAEGLEAINAAIRDSADYRALGVDATSQIQTFDDALTAAFSPSKGQQVESFFGGLGEAIGFTSDSDIAVASKRFEEIDSALTGLVSSGKADLAAAQFDAMAAAAKAQGVSTEQLMSVLPGYGDSLSNTALQSELAGDASSDLAGGLDEVEQSAEEAADAIRGLGDLLLGQRGSARDYQAALDDMAAAIAENGRTLDITTEAGRANQAALDEIAQSTQEWAAATFEATGSVAEAEKILASGRGRFLAFAESMGMGTAEAKALADQLFVLPDSEEIPFSTPGLPESTAEVLALDASIVGLDGKVVTVKEEGANPSKGRVMELDGAIFGLDGKTVKVQEVGATPSGNRVVRFQGKIYALKGKTVQVSANVTGTAAINAMYRAVSALNSKQITVGVHTRYTVAGRSAHGGIPINADGGMYASTNAGLIRTYAHGGFDGSFRTAQSQIRPAGGGGVLWAEEGAGPWESFISGHPAKAERSRSIWLETGRRLGMIQAYADGGVRPHYTPSYVPPAPRVTVTAPASPAPSIDYDRLGQSVARHIGALPRQPLYPSQRAAAEDLSRVITDAQSRGYVR